VVFARQGPMMQSPGGLGLPRPAPDLVALCVVLFVTFAMQFFAPTAIVPALLQLTPAVWLHGFAWQLITYPLAGFGPPSFWIVLELLMVVWFGSDVLARLRRRRFWTTLLGVGAAAGVLAVLTQLGAQRLLDGSPTAVPFQLIQGQRIVMTVLIAAFATLNGNATIYFMFVLPLRARWFLWLEIAVGFVAYLATKDLAGFAGICAATAITYVALTPGGPRRFLRNGRLRLKQRWLAWRLAREQRRRKLRVLDGGRKKDLTVN
jgi:hypothetical protein